MIAVLLFLNFALMILMPVALGWLIASRRHASWKLYAVGMGGFVLSQLFHIPFNWLVLQRWRPNTDEVVGLVLLAVFLGLSAGLFEEVTRYLIYRFGLREARSWGQGLMYGAGWGGIEAILLGAIGLLNFVVLLGMNNGLFTELIPAAQMPMVQQTIDEMLNAPWYMTLLGAVERAFTLCFHLSASILVLQAFLRRNLLWLGVAILWHTAVNATAVFTLQYLTLVTNANTAALATEAAIGLFALISLGIIFWLKTPEPTPAEPEPLPITSPAQSVEIPLTADMLERSKFS